MKAATVMTDQWSDFLLRRVDPYAAVKYEILLEWMGNIENKDVLVAGCGSGELCAFMAHRGANVDAFDIEERNVQLARDTAHRLNTSFNTFVATIENLDPAKKYDYVVATDVIEHIKDDDNAVKRLRDFVKDDGHVIITVPAFNFLMGYHDEILGHFRRYSLRSLKKVISPYLEIERKRYFGFFLIPVTYLVSCLLRKPYPIAVVGQVKESSSLGGKLLGAFFKFEKIMRFGIGTSLLMIGRPKK